MANALFSFYSVSPGLRYTIGKNVWLMFPSPKEIIFPISFATFALDSM